MKGTFILLWNPNKWLWDPDEYTTAVVATEAGATVAGDWSMGSRKSGISEGDLFFLLRQGFDRGIVGSGHFTGAIRPVPHWDPDRGGMTNGADIAFDRLVDAPERMPIEVLHAALSTVSWDRLQSSGAKLADDDAAELEALWDSHLRQLPYRSPEEEAADIHVEGRVTKVMVNRYERDRGARAKAIERWGTSCVVCGIDFGEVYGSIGSGFIHVHHLNELSKAKAEHEVDAVRDLRPVCPNCHAMLHRVRPPMTVKQLRSRMQRAARPK